MNQRRTIKQLDTLDEQLIEVLLGDPPAIEAGGSWRYGKRGSLAVHVDGPQRGRWTA